MRKYSIQLESKDGGSASNRPDQNVWKIIWFLLFKKKGEDKIVISSLKGC